MVHDQEELFVCLQTKYSSDWIIILISLYQQEEVSRKKETECPNNTQEDNTVPFDVCSGFI